MSEHPREGVYLDHALALIGEQVDDRIDELSRRRRIRARLGVAVLVLATVLSGSAAAYAVATSSHPAKTAAASRVGMMANVRCAIDASPLAGAYFTARYRALRNSDVDRSAVCATARADIASDPERYAALTPDQTIAAATTILEEGGGRDVIVLRASFGTVTPASVAP